MAIRWINRSGLSTGAVLRRFADPIADENWWWYGTGPAATDLLIEHDADILRQWSHGLNGGLPYWDSYGTDWDAAAVLAVLLSGDETGLVAAVESVGAGNCCGIEVLT